jgi:tRNA (guanine37-N1)-methyltransferase
MNNKTVDRIWIITLFPDFFKPLLDCGVAGQALRGERSIGAESRGFELRTLNVRDYSPTNYKGVDDSPYGGGPGMVMRADILKACLVDGVMREGGYEGEIKDNLRVILASPRGVRWETKVAREFAAKAWPKDGDRDLVFICGRYEGIDERFIESYVEEEYSLGDFILTGGEIAVMSFIDSALRFHPGVLGNKESANFESFENSLLEYPQYTRPSVFEKKEVPRVLLSGNHADINKFRQSKREELTKLKRPDLYEKWLKDKN